MQCALKNDSTSFASAAWTRPFAKKAASITTMIRRKFMDPFLHSCCAYLALVTPAYGYFDTVSHASFCKIACCSSVNSFHREIFNPIGDVR